MRVNAARIEKRCFIYTSQRKMHTTTMPTRPRGFITTMSLLPACPLERMGWPQPRRWQRTCHAPSAKLRFGLLVGIGGGIPNLKRGIDIRLGDMVVSQPTGTTGGVVQYDKGKSRAAGGIMRMKSMRTTSSRLKSSNLVPTRSHSS